MLNVENGHINIYVSERERKKIMHLRTLYAGFYLLDLYSTLRTQFLLTLLNSCIIIHLLLWNPQFLELMYLYHIFSSIRASPNEKHKAINCCTAFLYCG